MEKIRQGLKELHDANIRYSVDIHGRMEIEKRDLKKYLALCLKKSK